MKPEVVILGSGPSGLGAAHELVKRDTPLVIYDLNEKIGGLARSVTYKGNIFDVGPHRFYTKDPIVIKLWEETLGNDFLHVPRLTRIYYRNRFFSYPIKAFNVVANLGIIDTVRMVWSYFIASISPKREAETFEDWVIQKFGRRLYEMFFKTYTEKVWGVPCNQIAAKWAAQRIKGLDLREVIMNALPFRRQKVRSLIDEFRYPRHGAGMMYEVMGENIKKKGNEIHQEHRCVEVKHKDGNVTEIVLESKGKKQTVKTPHLFSSIPITEFVQLLNPPAPKEVVKAAQELRYRDHITVNLLLNKVNPFPDNWIYLHSPEVLMARLTSYNNFSDEMTTSPDLVAISCEYFCFRDEEIWKMDDKKLIEFATEELVKLDLLKAEDVTDGFVIRELDSYPLYYIGYREPFDIMKDYLVKFKNLSLIGRAGMFKYNNMDHALLSGIYAAQNYFGESHDVWEVGEETEYLEEAKLKAKEA